MENKLKTFIEKNRLDFRGIGSDLNSSCTILSGYALFLGILEYDDLANYLDIAEINLSHIAVKELELVFEYAFLYSYGEWWKNPDAHDMYTF